MNDLAQYGLQGIVIAGLAWYVLRIEKRHSDERGEWKKTTEKQFEDSSRVINENTNVLAGLKTLLENRR